MKPLNLKKRILSKSHIQNGRFESDFVLLETLITESNELIFSAEDMYYENLVKKLNNLLLQAYKKIPIIPPPLIDNKIETDIQTDAYIFNKFLVE